jgi:hypothetical protein
MQRNTPRTLGEYVKPRFGTFPQVVDMLIREISDQDPNEDNTDKEDELTEKLITAMYE